MLSAPSTRSSCFALLGGGVAGDLAGLPRSQLAVLPGTTHVTLADRPEWLAQAGAGVGAAVISVPASLYFGAWLANLSNNVYVGLVPSLLVMAIVPSLAVALAYPAPIR